MHKPTCTTCGTTVEPGTLLAHVLIAHPKTEATTAKAKTRTCYAAKCTEYYGPKGHVPGLEGPHAH